VAPDNALGRLSRMKALNDRAVSEASLNAANTKLSRLETALGKADRPDFGLCANGHIPIPPSRILLISPGHSLCPLRGKELTGISPPFFCLIWLDFFSTLLTNLKILAGIPSRPV